jgi:hypothetical protein
LNQPRARPPDDVAAPARRDTNAGAPTFHDTSGCVATNAANVTARVAYATHGVARFAPANLVAPAAHSKTIVPTPSVDAAARRRSRAAASAAPPPAARVFAAAAPAAPAANEPHRAAAAPAPARRRTAPEPNAWNAPARDRDALRSAVSSARKRSRFVKTFGGLTRAPGETSGDGERDPERSDDRERDRSGDRSRARERDRADAGGGPSERFFSRGGDAAALFVAAFARSFPGQSLGENVTSGARFFFSFAAGIVSGTSFPRGGSSAPSRTAERGGLGVDGFGSGSSGGSDEATPARRALRDPFDVSDGPFETVRTTPSLDPFVGFDAGVLRLVRDDAAALDARDGGSEGVRLAGRPRALGPRGGGGARGARRGRPRRRARGGGGSASRARRWSSGAPRSTSP